MMTLHVICLVFFRNSWTSLKQSLCPHLSLFCFAAHILKYIILHVSSNRYSLDGLEIEICRAVFLLFLPYWCSCLPHIFTQISASLSSIPLFGWLAVASVPCLVVMQVIWQSCLWKLFHLWMTSVVVVSPIPQPLWMAIHKVQALPLADLQRSYWWDFLLLYYFISTTKGQVLCVCIHVIIIVICCG